MLPWKRRLIMFFGRESRARLDQALATATAAKATADAVSSAAQTASSVASATSARLEAHEKECSLRYKGLADSLARVEAAVERIAKFIIGSLKGVLGMVITALAVILFETAKSHGWF